MTKTYTHTHTHLFPNGSSPGHRAEGILIHHSKRLSEDTHSRTAAPKSGMMKSRWAPKSIKDKGLLEWWRTCLCVSHYSPLF